MKPVRLTNLYFLTSAGNKMHSLVRKSSLVRRKGFMKPAPGDFSDWVNSEKWGLPQQASHSASCRPQAKSGFGLWMFHSWNYLELVDGVMAIGMELTLGL